MTWFISAPAVPVSGTMCREDFAAVRMDGTPVWDQKPSKGVAPSPGALWKIRRYRGGHPHPQHLLRTLSFVPARSVSDCIPDHTPYLKMKLGTVGLIPYEKPGSEALFSAFRERVVTATDTCSKTTGRWYRASVMDAFYCLEELEEAGLPGNCTGPGLDRAETVPL